MHPFLRKYLKKVDFSIVLIVILFLGIVFGPYLLSYFNQQEKVDNQGTTNLPPLAQNDPIENDLSRGTETDLTPTSEEDLTNALAEDMAPDESVSTTNQENSVNHDSPSYHTPVAYNPPTDAPRSTPAPEEIVEPVQPSIVDDLSEDIDDDEEDITEEQVIIDESDFYEESYYEYVDDTIEVDFGDKTTDTNNSTKVVYQAPVWENYDGSVLTAVSNWFDRVTNQNVKSIEFSLISAYDTRHEDANDSFEKAYQPTSVWDEIKNFFALIYQNDPQNVILTEDNGRDIVINQSVLQNVNVQYEILPNRGIKEEIEVVNADNLKNAYIFNMKLEPGVKYQKNTNLVVDAPADVYYFSDANDNYIAHFVPLVAYDSAGAQTDAVSMEIKQVEYDTHQIIVSVDPEWMYDEDRSYPIYIDPSIVHDTQVDFDTADSLNRVTTTSDPTIELDGYTPDGANENINVLHFDELADNSCDTGADACSSSKYNLDATVASGTTVVDGKYGKAREFNGASDYMYWSGSYRPYNTFTMEAWFTVDSTHQIDSESTSGTSGTSGQRWLFYPNNEGSYAGAGISVGTNGISVYEHGTSYVPALAVYNATLPAGWNHVAVVYENKQPNIYLNGTLVRTGLTSTKSYVYAPFYIGGYVYGWHDGKIDDVYITDRALSPHEFHINQPKNEYGVYTSDVLDGGGDTPLYNTLSWTENGVLTGDGETDLTDNGLVAHWKFNETSGTIATDSSGNGLNGTLTNFSNTSGQDVAPASGWTSDNAKWGGGALMCDNSNDYVSLGNPSAIKDLNIGTVNAWVKSDTSGVVMASGHATNTSEYPFFMLTNWGFYTRDASTTRYIQNTSALDNQWHYLTWSSDGSTQRFYIDGVEQQMYIYGSNNGYWFNDIGTNTMSLCILDRNTDYGPLNGVIDSVTVYDRILSTNEILSNAQAANIEFQTRTGTDTNPYDGGWEDWKPAGSGTETTIDNLDNGYLYDTSESGLVAYWPMDDGSGTNVDDPVNNNDGAASGTTIVDGKYGKARYFNGSGDYINLSSHLSNFNNLSSTTISAWIKANPGGGGEIINIGQGTLNNKFGFTVNADNIDIIVNNTSAILYRFQMTGLDFTDRYHMVTFKVGTSGNAFYIDGIKQTPSYLNGSSSNAQFTDDLSNEDTVRIGSRRINNTNDHYFDGIIDEVKVYNTDISDSAIYQDYLEGIDSLGILPCMIQESDSVINIEGSSAEKITSGQPKLDANTVGLWHLDETSGSGAYLQDSSGNNNDGTPTGTTLTNGISQKARYVAGGTEKISIPDDSTLDLTTEGTVSFWYKRPSSGVQTAFGKFTSASKGYLLQHSTDNKIYMSVSQDCSNNNYFASSSAYTDSGTWNHLAATYKAGEGVKVYLNGSEIAGTFNGTLPTSLCNSSAAVETRYDSEYSNSTFDELRIDNTALSADEIYEMYRLGRDHLINKSISSTDLSSSSKLPFYIASDQPGQTIDLTIGESAFANYLPDNNTVGLWHLEEETGSGYYIKDSSGYGNDGTPTSSYYINGRLGQSRFFDGSGDYITIPDSNNLDVTNQFTLSAWVNISGNSVYPAIVSKGGAGTSGEPHVYFLRIVPSAAGNKFNMFFMDSDGVSDSNEHFLLSNSTWKTNEWMHVVGTYDGDKMRIYINGQLDAESASIGENVLTNTYPVEIGRRYGDNANSFYGRIDEVRIDNIARTADEIRQAYEIGNRTHEVHFDFAANLDNGNLITGSGDYSFTVDATTKKGLTKGQGLYVNDKIIVRENYDGTEYIAQGTVTAVNDTTGAVTVSSWDAGSTFPSSGYTANTDVFKWQREYFDLTGIQDSHINAVENITLRPKNNSTGNTFWLDDINSVSNYLSDPTGSTINSTDNRYIQYRAILNTNNKKVTPSISDVTINFDNAADPSYTSASTSQSSLNLNNETAYNIQCVGTTAYESGTIECQGSWNNTDWYTIGSTTGPINNQTIQGTPDVSIWNGYPSDGSVDMSVRLYVNSTGYDTKSLNITKDTLAPAVTLINSVAGDTSSPYIDGTDDGSTIVSYNSSPDATSCKWDETDTDYDSMANTCSSTSSCTLDLTGSGVHSVFFRCLDSNSNMSSSSYQLDYQIPWSGYSKLIEFDRATPEADYQVRIDLSSTNFTYANAETDGADIRFTDVDNNQLPFWIQNWDTGGTSKVWVKVPDSGTKYIKMHYGDGTTTSTADGEAVFDFFDDFDDASLDTNKWSTYIVDNGPDPTVTESGGNAVVYVPYRNGSYAFLYSDTTFDKDKIVEGRASINYANTYVKGEFGFDTERPRPGYNSQISFLDDNGANGDIYVNMRNMTSPVGTSSHNNTTSTAGGTNVWHDYKIIRDGNAVRWYLDDSLLYNYPENNNYVQQYYPVPQGNLNIAFGNYVWNDNTAETQYLEWVFVRKHNGNDLVATINPEYTISSPDITAPSVTSVTSVEGDTTNTWTDTGDNDTTTITMNTPADTAYCKWDTTDTDYDSMTGICESTSSCTVDSTSEGTYDFYIRCMDFSGNKSDSSYHVEVIVDYYWAYNREVTISPTTPQANYPVKVEFTAATFDYDNTNADGSDIRFTDTSDNMLDYWIEDWNDGGTSYVWVNVPDSDTDTIKVIYGNSYHIDRGDGESVFTLFDDFSGATLDGTKWTEYNGGVYNSYTSTITVSSGLMDIYVPQVPYLFSGIESKTTYGYNYAIESLISADYGGDRTYGGIGFNDNRTDTEQNSLGEAISIEDKPGDTNITAYTQTSSGGGVYGSTTAGDYNVWHNYKITRPASGNQPKFYLDNTLFATSSAAIPTVNLPVTVSLASPSNAGIYPDSEEHTYVDWIFVRPFPGDDPVVTLGSESSSQSVNPRVTTIKNVGGDNTAPYIDTSDNGITNVVFKTADQPTNVKWDIIDTDFDSMSNNCNSTTECTLNLTGEGVKTVYFRATDGTNKSTSSFQLEYTIQETIQKNLLSSSLPGEDDLTLTITILPDFAEAITDGSLKLIMDEEFDFTGLTVDDVAASGGDVTWTNDEIIYAGGTQIAQATWLYDVAYAQGENSITFNFTGDLNSEDGEITFIISGVNAPDNPPTEGPYDYIVEWYELHDASGSPLYIKDGKVHINEGTTVTASIPTAFSFTISPVGSGTVNGATITQSTSVGNAVNFGTYTGSADRIAAHDLIVSSNTNGGYQITVQYTGQLSSNSDNMDNFTGSNAVPTNWASPPGTGIESYFGYTSEDGTLAESQTDRFTSSGGNKWAAYSTTPAEVAYHDGPASDRTDRVGYRLELTGMQPAGIYTTNLIYIATPTY